MNTILIDELLDAARALSDKYPNASGELAFQAYQLMSPEARAAFDAQMERRDGDSRS